MGEGRRMGEEGRMGEGRRMGRGKEEGGWGEGRRMKRGKEGTMGRRQGVGECTVAEGKKREMCEKGGGRREGEWRGEQA